MVAGARMPVLPELDAPSDVVFPKTRLGFMDAHRAIMSERRAVMLSLQPLVVESVTRLVKHAVERLREIALIVARGQARVARPEAGAKRVRRGVDASGIEVKADGLGDFAIERLLGRDRILRLEQSLRDRFAFLHRRTEHANDGRSQFPKKLLQMRSPGPALMALQQRVI